MKRIFVALATAGVWFLSARSGYAADAPAAPAAPPPPSAAQVVDSGCGCQPTCCDHGWSVWLEPMFLKFHPSVSAWAVDGDAGSRPTGVVHEVECDYEFGARVGVAYMKPGSCVGFGLQVTWANSDASETAAAPAGGSLGLAHTSPDGADFVTGGTATHDSEIDYLVIDAGVCFHAQLGSLGAARFWGGARFAKIDSDVSEHLFTAAGVETETLVASTELLGYGIAAGGELRWGFCGGWSVFGRATGGILLSNIEGNARHDVPNATLTNVTNEIDRITPFIEMGVGVGWGTQRLLGSCVGLYVDLGFELTNWFNVLDPLTFVDDVKDSGVDEGTDDLGISAVTLKVTFTF